MSDRSLLPRERVLGLVAAPARAARDIIDLGRAVHGMLVELGRALERAKDDAAGEFTAVGRRLADDVDEACAEWAASHPERDDATSRLRGAAPAAEPDRDTGVDEQPHRGLDVDLVAGGGLQFGELDERGVVVEEQAERNPLGVVEAVGRHRTDVRTRGKAA